MIFNLKRFDLFWKHGLSEEKKVGSVDNLIQGGVYSVVIQPPFDGPDTEDVSI